MLSINDLLKLARVPTILQTFFCPIFRDATSISAENSEHEHDSSDLEHFPIFTSMHNPCLMHNLQSTITYSHTDNLHIILQGYDLLFAQG